MACQAPETAKNKDEIVHSQPAPSNMPPKPDTSSLEKEFIAAGMIPINTHNQDIQYKLAYADTQNFTGQVLYPPLNNAYGHPELVKRLAKAQELLKNECSNYHLYVFDCARPQSVQYIMYEKVKNTPYQRYVAEPSRASLHNYGCAVDISIADENNEPIDMGTSFDYFGAEAQTRYHARMLSEKRLSEQQIENRILLKRIMKKAGFRPILSEWWHFEIYSKEHVRANFTLIK